MDGGFATFQAFANVIANRARAAAVARALVLSALMAFIPSSAFFKRAPCWAPRTIPVGALSSVKLPNELWMASILLIVGVRLRGKESWPGRCRRKTHLVLELNALTEGRNKGIECVAGGYDIAYRSFCPFVPEDCLAKEDDLV